jgi:predicted hydrolase (HD superfamily)
MRYVAKFCFFLSKRVKHHSQRPRRLQAHVTDMKVSRLKKKFKDKKVAAGVNRDIILECEKTGLTLDEFMQIAIDAIKKIAKEVGLS